MVDTLPLPSDATAEQVAATACALTLSARGTISVMGRKLVVNDVATSVQMTAKLVSNLTDGGAHSPIPRHRVRRRRRFSRHRREVGVLSGHRAPQTRTRRHANSRD
jgi:hypothetical protein